MKRPWKHTPLYAHFLGHCKQTLTSFSRNSLRSVSSILIVFLNFFRPVEKEPDCEPPAAATVTTPQPSTDTVPKIYVLDGMKFIAYEGSLIPFPGETKKKSPEPPHTAVTDDPIPPPPKAEPKAEVAPLKAEVTKVTNVTVAPQGAEVTNTSPDPVASSTSGDPAPGDVPETKLQRAVSRIAQAAASVLKTDVKRDVELENEADNTASKDDTNEEPLLDADQIKVEPVSCMIGSKSYLLSSVTDAQVGVVHDKGHKTIVMSMKNQCNLFEKPAIITAKIWVLDPRLYHALKGAELPKK